MVEPDVTSTPSAREIASLLHRSTTALGDRLRAITADQWDLPTPCDEWNVRAVVEHLALSELLVQPMLERETTLRVERDLLGDDPYASWSALVEAADAALTAPRALDGRAIHPFLGEIDASLLAMMRVVDRVVHGWDLAVAIGFTPALPADLVATLTPIAVARADAVPRGFLFDTMPNVPPTADDVTRFVAIYGRDGSWSPPGR